MRYERHHVLKYIGEKGQEKLAKSTVVIIGVGAVGSAAAELIVRSGVGKVILIDHDVVEESNLQRQLLYSEQDIHKPKAQVAANRLKEINSEIEIQGITEHLDYENIDLLKADVILDCTDNMQTRFLINDYALKKKTPWIYSAAVEDRGMLYVTTGEPCFNCIFEKANSIENCETVGILNATSATVASMQVTEAIKIMLGEEPTSELIHFNIWTSEFRKLKVNPNPDCNACKGHYEHLNAADKSYKIEFCKAKSTMSTKPLKNMKLNMAKVTNNFKVVTNAGIMAVVKVDGEEIVVHDYGELYFKAEKNKDKLKILTEKIYSIAR